MHYFIRTYKEDERSNLARIDCKSINLTGNRTLFIFPGDMVVSFSEAQENDRGVQELVGLEGMAEKLDKLKKHANGLLKITKRILGGREALATDDIVLAAYPFDPSGTHLSEARKDYNRNPDGFFTENARKFVRDNLLELIVKEPQFKPHFKYSGDAPIRVGEKLTGTPYTTEELCNNMAHINIMGFSHGAVFAGEVCNCLKQYMRDVRYSEEDIKKALGQVNLLALSSVMQTSKPDAFYFNVVHFQSVNDSVIQKILPEFKEEVETKFKGKALPVIEIPNARSLRVICNTSTDITYFTNRGPDPRLTEHDAAAHQPRMIAAYRQRADNTTTVMVENVLRNMYFRDRKIDDISDYLLRTGLDGKDKVIVPANYDLERDLTHRERTLNDRTFVKFIRRVYEGYISEIIDEHKGIGNYKDL